MLGSDPTHFRWEFDSVIKELDLCQYGVRSYSTYSSHRERPKRGEYCSRLAVASRRRSSESARKISEDPREAQDSSNSSRFGQIVTNVINADQCDYEQCDSCLYSHERVSCGCECDLSVRASGYLYSREVEMSSRCRSWESSAARTSRGRCGIWSYLGGLPTSDHFVELSQLVGGSPGDLLSDADLIVRRSFDPIGISRRVAILSSLDLRRGRRSATSEILAAAPRNQVSPTSTKLDDTLWAYQTAYKTPIGKTPFQMLYGKSCNLPVEVEYKAIWATKLLNLDIKEAQEKRSVDLHELEEIRLEAYESSKVYKERTKAFHEKKITLKDFKVGDQVLLFNSRLKLFPGKLKSRWSGPFTIKEVLPFGAISLFAKDGSEFRVNGQRLKKYLAVHLQEPLSTKGLCVRVFIGSVRVLEALFEHELFQKHGFLETPEHLPMEGSDEAQPMDESGGYALERFYFEDYSAPKQSKSQQVADKNISLLQRWNKMQDTAIAKLTKQFHSLQSKLSYSTSSTAFPRNISPSEAPLQRSTSPRPTPLPRSGSKHHVPLSDIPSTPARHSVYEAREHYVPLSPPKQSSYEPRETERKRKIKKQAGVTRGSHSTISLELPLEQQPEQQFEQPPEHHPEHQPEHTVPSSFQPVPWSYTSESMDDYNEPLRSYIEKFKTTKSKIANLNEEVALATLRNSLWFSSRFREELTVRQLATLDDTLHKALHFAQAKEEAAYLALKFKESKGQSIQFTGTKKPYKKENPPQTQGQHTLFAIDNQAEDEEVLTPNPEKYYKYHKKKRHSTEEYRTLFRIIAAGDKSKKAPAVVEAPAPTPDKQKQVPKRKAPSKRERTPESGESPPPSPKQHISPSRSVAEQLSPKRVDFVMGGSQLCRDSVNSIKTHQRKVKSNATRKTPMHGSDHQITFWESKTTELDKPHDDALVIRIDVGNCKLSRIMVDTGSSVDVLFYDAIKKMGHLDSELQGKKTPLTGFSGETTFSLGIIQLSTIARGVRKLTNFIVVDKIAPFNAILGRPWLHAMKVVPSSYHQCVKFPEFPSNRGVATMQAARSSDPTQRGLRKALLNQICIDETNPKHCVGIGSDLEPAIREDLISFLKQNKDSFAWDSSNLRGISLEITSHELNVDPTFRPIKQKRRKLGPERAKALHEEVDRLLKIGYIREIKYPDWLANLVVVKKKNGKWRVCIDFTDLSKACPKDSFPLPHIDRLVEATAGHQLLSFMDAFSGYNQILMRLDDQEKIAFITDRGTYYYKVMPFGLKNAGATYQRLSSSGEFMGYIVTERGIEANPKQISTFLEIPSPKTACEVQRLTGRIAALNRFISRSTDKYLPFYQLVRKDRKLEWEDKCEQDFIQLKIYLTEPSILAKPEDGEPLYLYIAVSQTVISGVLVRKDHEGQKPIYYVSKTLLDAETRYPAIEILALAVVMSARKLRPYFQSHSIVVMTSQPIRAILHSPTQSGRLANWAIELSEMLTLINNGASMSTDHQTDKALLAGIKLALGMRFKEIKAHSDSQLVTSQFHGEYEATDECMEAYLELVKNLSQQFEYFELVRIFRGENTSADASAALASTSDPFVKKVISVEGIENPSIDLTIKHADTVRPATCNFTHVTRRTAAEARAFAAAAEQNTAQEEKKNEPPEDPAPFEPEPYNDWRIPIIEYIEQGTVPSNKWEARKLKAQSARYCVMEGKLIKRSISGPYMTCVYGQQTRDLITSMHEGHCDCAAHSAKYDKCQRHAPTIHQPTEELSSISSLYSFMKRSMDVVGPMESSGGAKRLKYLLVLTDYFSKWIKTKAYQQVKEQQVKDFLWENIVCRHGIPYEIVTDNGTNLTSAKIQAFCDKVLWANRTTPRKSNNKTPFSLTYGLEAVILAETSVPSMRRTTCPSNSDLNDQMLQDNIYLIEERRDEAMIRIQNNQQAAAHFYNSKIKIRRFSLGELVLRKVFSNTKKPNAGKQGTNWEGPYRIIEVVRDGVYKLEKLINGGTYTAPPRAQPPPPSSSTRTPPSREQGRQDVTKLQFYRTCPTVYLMYIKQV
ncbi:Ribonuclease H domain [Arabidopsis suecica]|uniref:Ribonuclease H domain n=1 Tax=Arabidopsis suecica TaxID=45249 RepID=A0A8T1YP42_ARASU|nr:Ribonuclease H domain [Arabidopsis suecica]